MFGMIVVMTLSSCIPSSVILGSGREARGAFNISMSYTELSVSSGITVELVPSLTGEGFITADEEVLEHVSIIEEDGCVKVSYEPLISVRASIKTVVTMPLSDRLSRLDVSSAGRVTSARRLFGSLISIEGSSAGEIDVEVDAADVSIDLSSAANFDGNVVARNLRVELGSAARCSVEGSADYCDAGVNSASNLRAFGLACRVARIEASSAGDVEISVTEELDARASSGGSVRYKGSPAITRRGQSGGGSVREVN